MIWNTIAHPRMMDGESGTGGLVPPTRITYSPIKFADTNKLSFYDIVVSIIGTADAKQYILVKGDFETIKKMLLNDDVVCGAIFVHKRDDEVANLVKAELTSFSYDSALDVITLLVDENSDLLRLLSDNAILATEPTSTDPIPGSGVA